MPIKNFQDILDKYRSQSFSEHDKPRYILDLLLSVITVSLETVEIVKGLPGLGVNDEERK